MIDINVKLSVKNKIVLIIAGSVFLTVATAFSQSMKDDTVTGISRPAAGQTKEVEINAFEEGEEEALPLKVKVEPKVYTAEETAKILEEAEEEMRSSFLGENKDPRNITTALDLNTSYAGGLVSAEWTSSDFETVSFEGEVFNDELDDDEVRYVNLPVRLTMGEQFKDCLIEVMVRAPVLSENERTVRDISRAIGDYDSENAGEDVVPLPEDVEGRSVRFTAKGDDVSPWIFIPLGIAGAVCIWFYERQKKQREQRERAELLSGEYSGLSSKLSLLCGAGMTVYGAWRSITRRYEADRDAGVTCKKESYERMSETLNMIDTGMGEPEAYTRFGELCGVREYKKLGSYLSEFVKKGTGDLKSLLYTEAQESFVRRKAAVKVRAEEAGTRLLFPMMLMLGVVMAIVLLPSVKSFVM